MLNLDSFLLQVSYAKATLQQAALLPIGWKLLQRGASDKT
jgi:hypothetical protein